MTPLTCTQCGEILPDIVDGDLTSERARELLAQAKSRPRCRYCLDTYKQTAALCHQALGQEQQTPEESERLLAFLRDKLHDTE